MAAVGLVTLLSVAGTVASVVGGITAANAAGAAGEYNARLQERDAEVADQNRRLTLQQSDIDVADSRRKNQRVLASIRASYGASGLDMVGSPLDVLEDTATEQELDTQRVQYEGKVRAREGALQMLGLREGATTSRMEGQGRKAGGVLGAIGSGLSGAGTTLARTA